MPNARNEGHRWRAGTYTSSGITSSYAITAFTVQSDQQQDNQVVVPWSPPAQALPPEYARVTTLADGSQKADGYLTWEWVFPYLTFGQFAYLVTTFWSGGVYSAAVSVGTYSYSDTMIYINAIAHRPVVGQDMQAAFGGYENVKVRFTKGVTTS